MTKCCFRYIGYSDFIRHWVFRHSSFHSSGVQNLCELSQLFGLSPLAKLFEQFKPCSAAALPAWAAGLAFFLEPMPLSQRLA